MRFLLILIIGGLISSCHSSKQNDDEVVCQTVHKYGVSLEPEDWSSRGQNGQVISLRKDGVTVIRNFDVGILNGESTYSFPYREMIQKKELYVQGNLTQDIVYYPNGAPQSQTDYKANNTRFVTSWYENGAPYAKETYQGNKLIEGEYTGPDQIVESRIAQGEGTRTLRDETNQLQSVDIFKDGMIVLSTTYYPNGTPSTVTPYVNGVIQGTKRTYLPSGEPSTVESWEKGVQQGITITYEYGAKRSEIPFVNGHRQGVEKRYCDDGKAVIQEWTWVNDQKHGPVTTYVGNTQKVDWFFYDTHVPNKATFDMMNNR